MAKNRWCLRHVAIDLCEHIKPIAANGMWMQTCFAYQKCFFENFLHNALCLWKDLRNYLPLNGIHLFVLLILILWDDCSYGKTFKMLNLFLKLSHERILLVIKEELHFVFKLKFFKFFIYLMIFFQFLCC